jgi:hypothetical protein
VPTERLQPLAPALLATALLALALALGGCGSDSSDGASTSGGVDLENLPEIVQVANRNPDGGFNNSDVPVYELVDASPPSCELRQIGVIEAALAVRVLETQPDCVPAIVHVRPIGVDVGPQGWILGDHVYVAGTSN